MSPGTGQDWPLHPAIASFLQPAEAGRAGERLHHCDITSIPVPACSAPGRYGLEQKRARPGPAHRHLPAPPRLTSRLRRLALPGWRARAHGSEFVAALASGLLLFTATPPASGTRTPLGCPSPSRPGVQSGPRRCGTPLLSSPACPHARCARAGVPLSAPLFLSGRPLSPSPGVQGTPGCSSALPGGGRTTHTPSQGQSRLRGAPAPPMCHPRRGRLWHAHGASPDPGISVGGNRAPSTRVVGTTHSV